jgi:hypothetical protein
MIPAEYQQRPQPAPVNSPNNSPLYQQMEAQIEAEIRRHMIRIDPRELTNEELELCRTELLSRGLIEVDLSDIPPEHLFKALRATEAGRAALGKGIGALRRQPPYFARKRKLTGEVIEGIRRDVLNGTTRLEAALKYSVSTRSVCRALRGI